MRYVAVSGPILAMLLLAAAPAGAQSMADLGAAMGINGTLNGTAASNAGIALKAREAITSHAPSGNGGWVDAGGATGPTAGSGKSWATATSSSNGGKGGWATASSSSPRTAGGNGWATASSGGGKGAWISRNDPGAAQHH